MKINILFFLFIFILPGYAKWVESKKNTITSFVHVPELFSTEAQMGKYCSQIVTSSGQFVSCPNGIEILKNPISTCEFPELKVDSKISSFLNYVNPLSWASGSLKQLLCMISIYQNSQLALQSNSGFNPNLDANLTLLKKCINSSKLNFGQNADMQIFANLYERHIINITKDYPKLSNEVVLFGVSRGAATILNFISENNLSEVKAIVCESCFDSIPSLLSYRFPFLQKIALRFIETFTMFKKDGPSPIVSVNKIPEIPILLITSLKDEIVPFQCVVNLYIALKNSGHKNTYLLILKNSTHLNYMLDDPEDKKNYEQTVHTFYKKFKLSYIPGLVQDQIYFETITNPVLF